MGKQLYHAVEPFIVPAGGKGVNRLTPIPDYIVDGAKYVVTVGGVPYEAIAKLDQRDRFCIGNESLHGMGGPDTGEDFYIVITARDATISNNMLSLREAVTEDTTVTVELVTETESIDAGKKYLLHRIFPYIIARAMCRKSETTVEPGLISSDGYTLSDANGLYLIPKEENNNG